MLKLPTDTKPIFRMMDMEPGQISVIEDTSYNKTYIGLIIYCFVHNGDKWGVALNNSEVWTNISKNTIAVRLLQPGELLEVV